MVRIDVNRKILKILFLTFLIVFYVLFSSGASIRTAFSQGDNSALVTENTIHSGDLLIEGNQTLTIVDCIFNVTGTTVLKDRAKLVLLNATFDTDGLSLHDFSELKMDHSTYSLGIEAYGFSLVRVANSSFPSSSGGQLIELSDAASLNMDNVTLENMLIRLSGQSDATIYRCGPNIVVQVDANTVHISNSMVNVLAVYGYSHVEVTNSSLGYVVVANNGVFTAYGSLITGSLSYFDYHATVKISECFVTSLIDGIIYEDENVTLLGDNIFVSNFMIGIEDINSTIVDRKYILYLLGENGRYELNELTSQVTRVLVEASEVTARAIEDEDMVFFVGGNGALTVENSRFNRILAMTTSVLAVYNCSLKGIDFTDEMVSVLRIVNSTVISDEVPAVTGGWTTDALIDSSDIHSQEDSSDISIEYINGILLRKLSDITLTGSMGVFAMVYNSEITFSEIGIERVYNHLNQSKIWFTNGAEYVFYATQPTEFVVNELSVTPQRVRAGGDVEVIATIENTGDLSGEEYLGLYLDGNEVDGFELSLEGRETKEIRSQLKSEEVGKHIVELLGVTASFNVVNQNSPKEILRSYWPWFSIMILIIVGIVIINRYLRR